MLNVGEERRKEARDRVHLWAVAQRAWDTNREKLMITDLSSSGFNMHSAGRYAHGDVFFLELNGGLIAEVGIVRADAASSEYGCRFLHPLRAATVDRLLEESKSAS